LIEKHNKDQSQTYKMGINQFSALTDSEFQQNYLNGYQKSDKLDQNIKIDKISEVESQQYSDY
jgi:hypothetical protein